MRVLPLVLMILPLRAWAIAPGDGVVVHFKDGAAVSGVLTELTGQKVEIEVGGARVTWEMENVSRLEVRKTDVQEFIDHERQAGSDAEKLRELARFARARRLYTYYERLAKQVELPQDEATKVQPVRVEQKAAQNGPPPMGFSGQLGPQVFTAPPAVQNYYASAPVLVVPVLAAPAPQVTRAEQEAFLREQAARRDALRHRPTNPTEVFQFRLQEALDRQAHGLSFESEPL